MRRTFHGSLAEELRVAVGRFWLLDLSPSPTIMTSHRFLTAHRGSSALLAAIFRETT